MYYVVALMFFLKTAERTVKVYIAVTSFFSEQIFMKTTCRANKMSSVGKEGSLKTLIGTLKSSDKDMFDC